MQASETQQEIYSVSRLNQNVRLLLEGRYPCIWVAGEISNFVRPSSGHWYFSLKDDKAQIRCAMFTSRNHLLGFTPENGDAVVVRAKVSLYPDRGDYQLIVEFLEATGDGLLQKAFNELKQALAKRGFFDRAHKKPLPRIAKQIGIISSSTGAALRDILSVLRRRFPAIPIIVYPTEVQGKQAAPAIAQAIRQADAHQACDVLILARGGGSLEDLWGFNESLVAEAIYACSLPLVSGVGHEIDFTISDFVADVRAPTPSAAAELVVPDQQDVQQQLVQNVKRLQQCISHRFHHYRQNLDHLRKRLQHPGDRIHYQAQRCDHLLYRLQQACVDTLKTQGHRQQQLTARLARQSPQALLRHHQQTVSFMGTRLQHAVQQQLKQQQYKLQRALISLQSLSPTATLSRGYAIVRNTAGVIIKHSQDVAVGDTLVTQLANGDLTSVVVNPQNGA